MPLAEKISAVYNSEQAFAIRNLIQEILGLAEWLSCPECQQSICRSVRDIIKTPSKLLD